MWSMTHANLVDITGTTKPEPYHLIYNYLEIRYLPPISTTYEFAIFKYNADSMTGYQVSSPNNCYQMTCPIWAENPMLVGHPKCHVFIMLCLYKRTSKKKTLQEHGLTNEIDNSESVTAATLHYTFENKAMKVNLT